MPGQCRFCGHSLKLSAAERDRILTLYLNGEKRSSIMLETGVSGKTVDRVTATLRALRDTDGQREMFR